MARIQTGTAAREAIGGLEPAKSDQNQDNKR